MSSTEVFNVQKLIEKPVVQLVEEVLYAYVIYEQTGPKAQKGKAKPTSNPNEGDSASGNDEL